jgi:hypothetical protein
MYLSQEEKLALEQKLLAELEEEHRARRTRAMIHTKEVRNSQFSDEFYKAKESELLREEVRIAYYKENGYKLVINEKGLQTWLSPEEVIAKESKKNRSRKNKQRNNKLSSVEDNFKPYLRTFFIYSGAILFAVFLGLLVARAGS